MNFCRLRRSFVALFGPRGEKSDGHIFFGVETDKNQGHRILAICFMASIAEAGDA